MSELRALVTGGTRAAADEVAGRLREAGYELTWRWVESSSDLEEGLGDGPCDLVVALDGTASCDPSMVLEILRGRSDEIPVLALTDGADTARSDLLLGAGASDSLDRRDHSRFLNAVRREVAGALSRRTASETRHALQRSEDYNRALLNSIPDLISRVRRDGTYLDFVPGPSSHPASSEVIGRRVSEVLPAAAARRYLECIERTLRHGSTQTVEYFLDDPESGPRTFESRMSTCGADEVLDIARDVTQERKQEQRHLAGQRMQALGRLSGGIAHDFNNLMTIIGMSGEIIGDSLPREHTLQHEVGAIAHAVERASQLTVQLLAFSRRQVQELSILDLNRSVQELEQMLSHVIGEDVTLITDLDPGLGAIRADPSQIEQILLNLVLNARDAMPEGGRLIIETANTYLDETYERKKGVEVSPGPFVVVTVTDTGHGMDAETRARVFEPFFTTKGGSKGTGLGLSTVYGIVKQSGGFVWVYSELGYGTTFRIYLPRVEEAPILTSTEPAPPLEGGHETILLVEDEPAVRKVTARMLTAAGYSVLTAGESSEALERSEGHTDPIDLLITDMVMPNASGRALADQLTASRPELLVLFISGYTHSTMGHSGALEPGYLFLQKPFSRDSLLRKVREALATRR